MLHSPAEIGLRRRTNTLTEVDELQPLLPTHVNTTTILEESRIPCSPSRALVCDTADFISTSLTSFEKSSPGTCSTSSSLSESSLSTREYVARVHPTLLQHYYDLIMATAASNNSLMKFPLPQLAFQEIVLGEIIGRGGFSFVHEIIDVRLQEIYDTGNDEAKCRAEFAASFSNSKSDLLVASSSISTSNAVTLEKKHSPYVLKTLRPDLPEDEHNKGIIDLAVEAQFLSSLTHPHILSLRASSNSDPLESRYFVILDRLVSTLDHKLKIWGRDVDANMGYWFGRCIGYCCGRMHVLHRIWMERFQVARDVASALEYLHQQDIVYRDLKPDNIGFNAEGDLKMFDFGLAKRITNADKVDDDLYNLTGNTGSLRYMAPEVALNLPYSLSVDAYSFGVLLWQLCALKTPYSGYSCKMHADLVVGKGYRPQRDASWPESWSLLMSQCWSSDHKNRPSFEHILKVISDELDELTAEGDSFIVNESRSSKETEKIRARKPKSFKIRARKDAKGLDMDTRLAPKPKTVTERKHNTTVV